MGRHSTEEQVWLYTDTLDGHKRHWWMFMMNQQKVICVINTDWYAKFSFMLEATCSNLQGHHTILINTKMEENRKIV